MTFALQTAGVDILLKVREVSFMGVVLLSMVLLLVAVVWTASKMADAKNKLARELSGRAEAWYIATGKVCGRVVYCLFFLLTYGVLAKFFFGVAHACGCSQACCGHEGPVWCSIAEREGTYMTRCDFLLNN